MDPTDEQKKIIDYIHAGRGHLVVDALAGTGKCLGAGTPVLMFDGRVVPVETIKAGDQLMGPDNEPRNVQGVSRGRGPLVRIVPVKGDSWICNDAHILTLTGTNFWRGQTRDVSVQTLLDEERAKGQRPDRNWKLFRVGVDFPSQPVPVDPYLAGLWLGDGSRGAPQITNCDPEIIAYCETIGPTLGLETVVTPQPKNNTFEIRFRAGTGGRPGVSRADRANAFLDTVRTFVNAADEKIIRHEYLVNSREVRLALLAGLADTDGHVATGQLEITTKSEALKDGLLFLARSLGFAAYAVDKRSTIKSIGFEGVYHRVSISGDLDEIPCLVPRRQAPQRQQIKRVTVTGFDIEPIGDGEYFGFTLDRDGRFLLGDFTVTHNTKALLWGLEKIPQQSILLAAFGKPIAVELESRVPKLPKTHAIHVKTFHALGRGIIAKHYPRIKFDKSGTETLINETAGSISFNMRRAAVKLTRLTKELIAIPTLPANDVVMALGYEHNVFTSKMGDREIGLTVELVRDAYLKSLAIDKRECLDFCDMVWAPVALNLAPPSRYLAIIVDELQDISEPQLQLLQRLMIPDKSRFIGSGDCFQDLYQWRGSMGARAWSMLREMGAKFLPLTMTWRCSKAVVEAANEIVPELRAAPNALEGSRSYCKLSDLPFKLANSRQDGIHTFVLSRTNADLVDAALYLWTQRVSFQLNTGKELLAPIFDLLSNKLDTRDEKAFRKTLSEWYSTERAKAEKNNATAYAETLEEQCALLLSTLKYAKPREIIKLLHEILVPNQSGILLSTVHKVKGLEAERVYLLKQTFGRYRTRKIEFRDWAEPVEPRTFFLNETHELEAPGYTTIILPANPSKEELNIEYVAQTRACEHLIYVDIEAPRAPADDAFVLSESLEAFTQEQLVERLQRVENMATRTKNSELANAFMDHAKLLEGMLDVRHR